MRRSNHCLHHVLPPLRTLLNLRYRGHPYNLLECSTNVYKKSFVVHCLYGFIKLLPVAGLTLFPLLEVFFCSSLVLVFSCVTLLLIAMSCHCFLCAFVTLNKKITYLLIMFWENLEVLLQWIVPIEPKSQCRIYSFTH